MRWITHNLKTTDCGVAMMFFRGERPGHLKANLPSGGPEGEGPPDGSEDSFFKTIQSIRK